MKRSVILILFIIIVLSCSIKKEKEISLFNNIVFEMYDGEAIINIKPKILNMYTEYFNNQLIQVPLFRYIESKNYKIFIGIPYNTSIEQLIKSQLAKPDSSRLYLKSDSLFYFTKYVKDGFYITEYASASENKPLIFTSTMADSQVLSDSLFNELELSKRIKSRKR